MKENEEKRKMVSKASQISESKAIAFTYNTKPLVQCDHIRVREDY